MPSKNTVKRETAPKRRTFQVIVTCRVELELDQSVIDAVDDSWRKQFVDIRTPEEIASHIGTAMAREGIRLDFVDGFADQSPDGARISDEEWEAEATEYK